MRSRGSVGKAFTILGLALMIVASGCVTPDVSSSRGGKADPRTGRGSLPAEPVRVLPDKLETPKPLPAVNLGASAGEPNIAVAPDGTIYVTPITNLYRSDDGGKTFKDLGTTKTSGHGDGDIAVTGDGRLHWLGLGGSAPKGPIPYQYSDNKGEKFTEPRDVSSGMGSDREWIDARPEGVIYTSWRGAVTVDGTRQSAIATNTSFDNGQTWQTHLSRMYANDIGGNIVHGPVPGTVYEAITTLSTSTQSQPVATSGSDVVLAVSHDNGTTWAIRKVFSPTQSVQYSLVGMSTSIFPSTAVDQAGNIYVVFAADQQSVLPLKSDPLPKPVSRFGVFLMVSGDDGKTWTGPKLVSDPQKAAVMPWVAAGAKGRIAITFYENTVGLPNDVLPDLWNVKLVEAIQADKAGFDVVRAQLNSQPSHIGSICTAGTGCVAGGDRSLLDYFEVALTPAGMPVVTWASSNGGTVFGGIPNTQIYFGTVTGTPLQ